MKNKRKTKAQLVTELAELRQKIAALEASAAGRRQLERESAKRRLYLESVLACAPGAIVTMDAEHNILEWNAGAERLFGYTPAEVVGRNIDALVAGPNTGVSEKATGLTRQILTGKSIPPFETVRYRKDGSPVNVRVSGTPILLEDKVIGVVAAYTDITARVQAEEELTFRVKQLTALSQAAQALTASLQVDQVLSRILSLGGKVTAADYTTVLLVDKAGRVGQSAENLPGVLSIEFRAREGGLTEWIERSGQAVIIDEIGEDGAIIPPLGEGAPRLANSHIVELGIKAVAGLPLVAKGNLMGVLYLHSHRPCAFRDQLPVLTTFARTVSVALENARLYRAEHRRAQELQALYDIALSLTSQRELALLLPEIVQQAVELLEAETGSIYLVDQERRELRLTTCHGLVAKYNGVTLKPGEGLAGQVFLSGKPLIVDDYRTWEGRAEVYEADQPFTAVIEVPLKWQDEVIGVLAVTDDSSARTFTQADVELATLFANQAAIAIENARLHEAEQAARESADTLREVSHVVNSTLELDTVLSLVLRQAKRVLTYNTASILLFAGSEHTMAAVSGYEDEELVKTEVALRLNESPILHAMSRDHRPIVIADVQENKHWVWVPGAENIRAWIGAPLLVRDEMIGVLMIDSTQPGDYTAADASITQALANQAAIAIENARLYEAAQQEIAERQRAEDALRASEEYARRIIESSLDTIITVDIERRIVEFNKAAQESFGYQVEEILGKHVDALYANPQEGLQIHQTTLKQGQCTRQVSARRKDGRVFPSLISSSILRDARGEPVGVMGISRDVTESKRAQEALDHRLLALTQPMGKVGNLKLTDVIDVRILQELQDGFAASYDVASLIFDAKGVPITKPSHFSDFCTIVRATQKGMERCEASNAGLYSLASRGLPTTSTCRNFEEIMDGAAPIFVGDKHVATWGIGQWLTNDLSEDKVRSYSEEIGADADRLVAAGKRLDTGSKEQLERVISFVKTVADSISLLGLQNIQQARDITERKQAEKALQWRNRELALLNRAIRSFASTLDLGQVLDTVLEEVRRLLNVTACSIWLIEPGTGDLVCRQAATPQDDVVRGWRLSLGEGICGWVALHGESLIVPDTWADERYFQGVDEQTGLDLRAILTVPLRAQEDVIGVLQVLDTEVGRFGKTDLELLEPLVASAAIAIENARLYEIARQRVAGLETLQRTSLQLSSTLDLSTVLNTIAESSLSLVGAADCHIYLYDKASATFTFGAALWENGRREAAVEMPRSDGFTATVARAGQVVVINDTTRHPLYDTPEARRWGVQAIAGFPLKRAGRVLGVFNIAFLTRHTFGEEELRVLGLLADQAAIAIENARLYEQARRDAETKSTLLREVNHRVKNNLTAIIGLLYAERRHAAAEDRAVYQPIMQNLVNRVQGLATVHSMLSASEWAPLSLSELTTQIIHSSLQMLPRDKRVAVNVTPSSALIAPGQAHNAALVINELATNTVKHGLQDRASARITVRIELDGDMVMFEFRDDGPGYPKEVLQSEYSNVGFDLIRNIVSKNLRGELALRNNNGAVALIRFDSKT